MSPTYLHPSVVMGPHGRLEIKKVDKEDDDKLLRLVVLYSNRGIECAHPRHMLNDLSECFNIELPTVQFAWCLKPNLRSLFYKTGTVFRNSSRSLESVVAKCQSGACASAGLPEQYKDAGTGHLHCKDTSWISEYLQLPHLAELLSQGLNHVPLSPICPDEVMNLNCWVAEQVVNSLLHAPIAVEEAVAFAVDWTMKRLPSILQAAGDGYDTDSDQFLAEVQQILSIAFVSGQDKAANHPFFVCKDYALLLAAQNLQSASSFRVINGNPVSWLDSQIQDLLRPHLPDVLFPAEPVTPIMFPLYKPKKGNYRYITSTTGSVYEITGQICHYFSLALLFLLKEFCGLLNAQAWNMHRVAVQFFGIIQDFRDCIVNLPLDQRYSGDFTADISKCFDSIPTDPNDPSSLQQALGFCLSQAVSHYSRQHKGHQPLFWLKVSHGSVCGGVFDHRKKQGWYQVPIPVVMALQHLLIGNMFVQVGPLIGQQILGIPQGIPCGPTWTNLFLFSFEFKYLQSLLRSSEGREVLKAFPFVQWFRFIDDVKVLNNPKAQEMLREMYPSCLLLEPTSVSTSSGLPCNSVFLDINCSLSLEGELSFHSVFKTQTLPFQPVQYIKLRSNRPVLMCFNTLKGLSYSAAAKCSSPDLLVSDLKTILKVFKRNGFPHKRCVDTVLSFLASSDIPSASFDLKWFAKSFRHRFQPWYRSA
jgi:hypothetical protein